MVQNPVNLIQNDVETLKNVCSEGFLYLCGLPSLRFFLPHDDCLGKMIVGGR
ncbi:hypothetical protein Hanom_Chr10g00936041 [Helianthus anomalus]